MRCGRTKPRIGSTWQGRILATTNYSRSWLNILSCCRGPLWCERTRPYWRALSTSWLNSRSSKQRYSVERGRKTPQHLRCRNDRFRLTAPHLLLDDCGEWTLTASLMRLSSFRKCSKRQILGHSAQATSLLPIAGTTKCSHIARGFSFGSGMGSVAEPSPQCFDWAKRRANLVANGREKWRRRKLPVLPVCLRNSRRVNKTSCRTSKRDISLKLIRSAVTQSKDNEEIRPLSANRNTIKALEQRGLIRPGKGRDPLTIVWRLKKKID